jgi:hypothetical protein
MQQEHFPVSPAMKFKLFLLHGKGLKLEGTAIICFTFFSFVACAQFQCQVTTHTSMCINF